MARISAATPLSGAGSGEVVLIPGDGHLLAKSHDALIERLDDWLPPVLGLS